MDLTLLVILAVVAFVVYSVLNTTPPVDGPSPAAQGTVEAELAKEEMSAAAVATAPAVKQRRTMMPDAPEADDEWELVDEASEAKEAKEVAAPVVDKEKEAKEAFDKKDEGSDETKEDL